MSDSENSNEAKSFNENDVDLKTINDVNTDADEGTGGEGDDSGADEWVPTPMEEKALARGWKPEENWSGDPEAWTDARNYVQHGELMDKISKQSVENKKLSKSMDLFKKMQSGIQKTAVEEAKKQLLADKVTAYENQDFAAVVGIEEDIKIADAELQATDEVFVNPEETRAADFADYYNNEWKPKNTWYSTNKVMKAYSDQIGVDYYNKNPDIDPSDVFKYVDAEMKENFPEEFGNQNRQRPAAVGGGQVGGQSGGRSTVNKLVSKLSKVEREIGDEYVKAGYFKDIDAYASALNEME